MVSSRSAVLASLLGVAGVAVVVAAPATGVAEERDAGAARPGPPSPAGGPRMPAGHVVPPDIEDVEHMCALLTACDRLPLPPGLVPLDFASCTRALYAELSSPSAVSFSLTLRECGLRASSCGELRSCALRGARADVCAGRGKAGPVDMCDGDGRAITCVDERVSTVRDCPRGGEQCVVRDGKALCALGSCEADKAPSCSPSGTRILECKKGKLVSLDCAAFGLRCASSADGPRCATAAAACTEGSSRCDGSSAVACWHGHEVRVDCGARGLSCAASASASDASASASAGASASVGACKMTAPATGACDPAAPPRCDGATLRWCAWGQPRGYLCKSVGLSRCVADGHQGARCAP